MDKITLYHGSERIVERPDLIKSVTYNDFGAGFYCTKDEEVAKEWACGNGEDGYVNVYAFSFDEMRVFDVTKERNSSLAWLSLILSNRKLRLSSVNQKTARDFIVENYLPDVKGYDVIVGARGDDSYFAFVKLFLDGEISLGQLDKLLSFDKSNLQYVLVSDKAIKMLKFADVLVEDGSDCFYKRKQRDAKLREAVVNHKEKRPVYIRDIMER